MISGPRIPFDIDHYQSLAMQHQAFRVIRREIVAANTGYGLRVPHGQTFRFEMVEGPQILDVDLFNANQPVEHYSAATQLWLGGGPIQIFSRIWSNPPWSRPLCTVIANKIEFHDVGNGYRDHKAWGAHCTPHAWMFHAGIVPNTCYDNLKYGCSMVGLGPQFIHDNLNLYMKAAIDPATGHQLNMKSDAVAGDYIQFVAEMDLFVVVSLCPYGDGSVVPEEWETTPVVRRPVAIEVAEPEELPGIGKR